MFRLILPCKDNKQEVDVMTVRTIRLMVLSFVLMFALAGTVYAAGSAAYVDLQPADAKALIDKTPGIIILDVSPYYAKGHLPKAINHPVGDGSLDKAIPTLDKSKTYLVYCHGDAPSRLGAQKLVDAGFMKVYRLAGNYKAWEDAGYPIEK